MAAQERNPGAIQLGGTPVFSSNSAEATLAATRNGLGIGVHAVSWAGRFPELERLFPEIDVGGVDMWLVTHEDLRTSARIRAMFDFLAERMVADAPVFDGTKPPH